MTNSIRWKKVSAFFLVLVMLFSVLPVTQVQAAASYGAFSMQNFGIYYQFDSSYPAPFGSNTNQRQFHAYYMNEDGGGHLKQTYCIQYGIQVSTGSHLTRQDDYSEFSAAQKELLNKVLIMGYSENTGTKYGGTWIEETIATQAMVWIVANNQYGTDWETKIANTLLASSPKARSIYDAIRSNVEQFNTIPSFTGSTAKAAPRHELKYNAVNGRYEITLTDSNKVLEQFDFSASGISFTRSGNKLTISTAQVLDDLVLTANKTLRNQAYPTLINGSPEYWTHPSWQNLTSINPEGTPAKVPAVMKLFTEKVGHVKLVKESEDGMVGGLPFRITGNGLDQTITTASDGTFLLKNILAGEYAITEVSTPNRYVVPETQVITVQPGRTASVKFSNILKKFHISITKTDTETGTTAQGDASLDGAVYEIYDAKGNLVERMTAGGAVATSSLLVLGTYQIYEVVPPKGYNLNENPVTVTGDFDGQTVEIGRADTGIQDAVIKGQVMLAKFADKPLTGDPNDGGLKTPLPGVEFTLTRVSTGEVACTITTDEDGYGMTPLLPYGTYRVEEVKADANDGYKLIEPFEVTIDTQSKIYKYILEDTVYESEVKIIKTDAETGNPIPLAGTTFKVMDSSGAWVTQKINYPTPMVLEEFETAADGTLVLPLPLPAGEYALHEVKAPEGYTVSKEAIPFTISSDNASALLKVEAKNSPVKGKVTIEKLGESLTGFEKSEDETYGESFTPIYQVTGVPGTVYEVVAVTDIVTPDGTVRVEAGSVVDTLTTGADGKATSAALYLGQYQLVEQSVPLGFVLDSDPIPFALTYADQETALVSETVQHENMRQRAAVTINKTAEMLENQAYNPYPDIAFGLYNKAELVNDQEELLLEPDSLLEVITLDETGMGTVKSDLPFAAYYIKELAAGTGYQLTDQTYDLQLTHENTIDPVIELVVGGEAGIPNALMRGALRIHKTVEGSEDLKGFVFRIAGTATNDTPVERIGITDEQGEIHLPDLPVGEYTVTELAGERTVGYILPDSQSITIEAEQESQLAFKNQRMHGGFHLLKVDAADHKKRLDGAVFALYSGEGERLEEFTVKDGEYRMEGLLFGSYYLLEQKAPDNYALSDQIYAFTISEDGAVVEILAENEQIPEEPTPEVPESPVTPGNSPKTGDTTNLLLPLLLFAGSATGITAAVIKRKKLFGRNKQ